MSRRLIAVVTAFVLVIGQAGAALAATAATQAPARGPASAPIDQELLAALRDGSVDRFVVEFGAKANLAGASKITDHEARGKFVLDALTGTASRSQGAARALAAKAHAKATSYWLINVFVVEGDADLAARFAKLEGVARIRALKTYPLVEPVEMKAAILAASGDPEWGVAKIRAPEAWDAGVLGQGVVVANVDTGVDFMHPALINQYRGSDGAGSFDHDYNWWDPTGICGGEPCDNAGHGTHTMGTMVGGDGPGPFVPDIGVAPGARWIAAKGCEDFGCSEEALLSSGQWILAPTDLAGANPDPSKRPDIVNNSWGGGPGDPFYLETVQAWRAAGIIPVFASGNPGPFCGEGGSPGDFLESFSAGATDINDDIAEFSGRGPSVYGKINPDIAAPGLDVVSSVPGGGYESFSGTSMAAPHTSGTLALILSAEPSLIGDPNNFVTATDAVRSTAVDRLDDSCGGAEDGDPNNVYGDGRIDAKAAVDLVATGGTLAGTVTDVDTAAPVAGATVTASGGFRDFSVVTDAAGQYQMFLAAGIYAVTAQAFGYALALNVDVEVVTDETTTSDFALTALPRFDISGIVRAAEDESPIEGASVVALGTPVAPAITDATGAYSLTLPIGTWTIRASAGGCTENVIQEGVELVDHDISLDFALGRKLDDFGHGCRPIAFDWVDATTDTALYGDDFVGRLHLPFTFTFYGESYDQVFISDNGYVNFLGADLFNPFPVSIPSEGSPNAAIYALWRDLHLVGDAQVSYATIGSPGDRTFVLELTDIGVRGSAASLDLEIKLHESGETVDLLYGDNPANPGDGRGATIGIENADGTDALEFSFGDSLVTRNSAYRYELVQSGLVHGTVTDLNDGLPIAGATVFAEPGLGATTTAADGTYSLRLYPGDYDLTISAPGYIAEVSPITILDGGDVTHDAALAAPVPTVDPTSVSIEAAFGDDPVTTVVTLGNSGTAAMTWEAKERSRGSTPPVIGGTVAGTGAWRQDVNPATRVAVNGGGTALAHPRTYRWTAAQPSADMAILVYADDPIHPAPQTYVDQALQRLGLSYTAHYDADFEGFVNDLESGTWDLVIFADDNWGPDFSVFDALNAYVVNGGRLIFHSWVVEFDPSHPLFATLGFGFSESLFEQPADVHWWQPDHPAFTFPELAPEPTELDNVGFFVYGQRGDPIDAAEAIAGYTTPGPDKGQAALVIGNEERTAFRGFLDAQNSADLDGDGVPDGVELWENLAFGIGQGFFTDVTWLSEDPTTGAIGVGASDEVTLTIGDPNLAPGEYRASVVFQTSAPKPRSVTVDVTLTVALPDSWGGLSGVVTDAHTGEPIAGASVVAHAEWNGAPLDASATTAGDGSYGLLAPAGTWATEYGKAGYVTLTRDEIVEAGTTRTDVNAELHRTVPHGVVEGGPFTYTLTEGRTGSGTVTVSNPAGHTDLTFEVGEVNLGGGPGTTATVTAGSRGVTGIDPNAVSTQGGNRPTVTLPRGIRAIGDVLASWPAEGLDLPWGVGYTGNVWLSDPIDNGDLCSFAGICVDTEFSPGGTPTGASFETTFGDWAGDMAYDTGRGLLWQVAVGGDNGIYGLDPADGSVEQVITGSPWDNISQRGLAYDPAADVFYIGGWNEGIVYRVAGPSWPTPGETLNQCSPPDPVISGLAWNGSFGMLWEATNSESDTIYLLDPTTCEASMAIPHPDPFFNGAGLELDAVGNLWTVSQAGRTAYLIESGLPTFSDVPWLTVTPESGSVAPDGSLDLTIDVDTTGLEPGVYRAIVVVQTNDPELGNVQVPVTLIVPAYQQGINAGGGSYLDPATGVAFAPDQAFSSGGFGYVGPSSSRSTGVDIAGTDRDPLYQDLRNGMTGYRFTVPNGVYQVDLSFAELQLQQAGARVFGVALEGSAVLSDFDVYAAAGGRRIALDRTFLVEVTDGVLDITFSAQRGDNPIINAILVTEVPPGSPG